MAKKKQAAEDRTGFRYYVFSGQYAKEILKAKVDEMDCATEMKVEPFVTVVAAQNVDDAVEKFKTIYIDGEYTVNTVIGLHENADNMELAAEVAKKISEKKKFRLILGE